MSIVLDSLTLPDDLLWIDEYKWSGVAQQVDILADGAVVVQADAQQTGRLITLQGGDDFGWLDRTTLEALRLLAAAPGAQYSLTLHDGTPRNVVFTGDRLTAAPVVDYSAPAASDVYSVTLYLMEL
ncbi:MAG: hypothetical protein RBR03_09115 [Desulfuromonas thiophila]|nr:hypothetical protein [Desulfuromonas thiophila]MDY0398805.1 hypothetical protein [Desulfuromonas thiophila]